MEDFTNFDYNPILRQLLVDYCLRIYEGDAILDDWHLWQEYLLLRRENRLNDLFVEECLVNQLNDGNYRG